MKSIKDCISKKNIALIALSTLVSQTSLADTSRFVGSFSLGPIWTKNIPSQTFFLAPDLEKTYTTGKSSTALFDGSVFLGLQTPNKGPLSLQLGGEVLATSYSAFSGNIWDDGNPIYNNFTYSYQIQHTHLAAKAKMLYAITDRILPWLSSSAGVGWNQANNFIDNPTNCNTVITPFFTNHTQTSFTYTVGTGVQYALNLHWQLGVGYEFADWGKSQLGKASDQISNNHSTINHVYANGVLFNLTYLA
ncbi:MAG: outer membrane beta-barrel protein [Legionellales bacterium]|nr:outer membrane beta-barrel protein [Legionellales bacterium]